MATRTDPDAGLPAVLDCWDDCRMPQFGHTQQGEWPLDPSLIYLNHGTVGVTPNRVLQAQREIRATIERQPSQFLLRELTGNRVGRANSPEPLIRSAAAAVARFVGARPDDVVFVDNATTGANAVLRSFQLGPGDEVLVSDLGYGGVTRTAEFGARMRGAAFRIVEMPYPVRHASELTDAWLAAVTPATRLAVVDHITAQSALVVPLAEIAAALHAKNVAVLADGAHAPGSIALDVPALGVDWYTANLHKWAWAPRSSGFLWAAPARQANLHAPITSWGLDGGFIAEFDGPGTRDPSPHLAAPAALDYMRELGVEAVRRYNHDLAWEGARLLSGRWKTPFVTAESLVGTMATVALPEAAGSTSEEAVLLRDALLFEDRIEVQMHAFRGRVYARVSAQIYNEMDDINRFAEAVSRRVKGD